MAAIFEESLVFTIFVRRKSRLCNRKGLTMIYLQFSVSFYSDLGIRIISKIALVIIENGER